MPRTRRPASWWRPWARCRSPEPSALAEPPAHATQERPEVSTSGPRRWFPVLRVCCLLVAVAVVALVSRGAGHADLSHAPSSTGSPDPEAAAGDLLVRMQRGLATADRP